MIKTLETKFDNITRSLGYNLILKDGSVDNINSYDIKYTSVWLNEKEKMVKGMLSLIINDKIKIDNIKITQYLSFNNKNYFVQFPDNMDACICDLLTFALIRKKIIDEFVNMLSK